MGVQYKDEDFDGDFDSKDPPFPCGIYECNLLEQKMYEGNDPTLPPADMHRATFEVVEVIKEDPPLTEDQAKSDLVKPPYGVKVGERRQVQGKIGPKKKVNGKEIMPPHAERVRDLTQALLRFEPRSEFAKNAADKKGQPISWGKIINEACDEDNSLAGLPVRVIISRIMVGKKNEQHPMYVATYQVSSRVEKRTSKILDGL